MALLFAVDLHFERLLSVGQIPSLQHTCEHKWPRNFLVGLLRYDVFGRNFKWRFDRPLPTVWMGLPVDWSVGEMTHLLMIAIDVDKWKSTLKFSESIQEQYIKSCGNMFQYLLRIFIALEMYKEILHKVVLDLLSWQRNGKRVSMSSTVHYIDPNEQAMPQKQTQDKKKYWTKCNIAPQGFQQRSNKSPKTKWSSVNCNILMRILRFSFNYCNIIVRISIVRWSRNLKQAPKRPNEKSELQLLSSLLQIVAALYHTPFQRSLLCVIWSCLQPTLEPWDHLWDHLGAALGWSLLDNRSKVRFWRTFAAQCDLLRGPKIQPGACWMTSELPRVYF